MKIRLLIVAVGLVAGAGAAHAGGDPGKGEVVFRKCAVCHSASEGTNRTGPSLFGVVGRPTASLPDFRYSAAMKAYGAAGHVWDEQTLTTYLKAPRDVVPGTMMFFRGLSEPEDIADVIAYLKSVAAKN